MQYVALHRLPGRDGPSLRSDKARRFLIRAELDAAFFHLYLPSDAKGDWVAAESVSQIRSASEGSSRATVVSRQVFQSLLTGVFQE